MSNHKGKFIAFEGGEGCGKSTQARLLAETLRAKGHEVVLTREPGGTTGAEAIRALLLDPPEGGWGPRAEALLFAAARSDHVHKLIRPAVARDAVVISDRFLDSSRAYQGGALGLGDEAILALHEVGSEGLRPDITLFLDIPADVAAARLLERDNGKSDAIGGRSAEFHAAVADNFRAFAVNDPHTHVIDAVGTVEEVHARILSAIEAANNG